jgi:hypothetical protein
MEINDRFFTDGGIGFNNPILTLKTQIGPAGLDSVAITRKCYVSIGTGRATDQQEEAVRSTIWRGFKYVTFDYWTPPGPSAILDAVTAATESKIAHETFEEINHAHSGGGKDYHYFRFDCEEGLGSIDLDKVDQLPHIVAVTGRYIAQPDVQTKIRDCARVLNRMM